ncbi:hypothetical protein AHF37_09288 [Paragonimus kellicotti]|nr:hypothetical protein AHF37_09288 [Paragonimus kellicotti]
MESFTLPDDLADMRSSVAVPELLKNCIQNCCSTSSSESGIEKDALPSIDNLELMAETPRRRERWNKEVLEFQEAKRSSTASAANKYDITDYESWKNQLRGALKAELDRRVREAVHTPPLVKLTQRQTAKQARNPKNRSEEQLRFRETVTKMNELVGGSRMVILEDAPKRSTLYNTIDLRLHPETRVVQKHWRMTEATGKEHFLMRALRSTDRRLLSVKKLMGKPGTESSMTDEDLLLSTTLDRVKHWFSGASDSKYTSTNLVSLLHLLM